MNTPSRRWWLMAFAVLWGLLLCTLGVYASLSGSATTKEQLTIVQAQPVVDRVSAEVLAAATTHTAEGTRLGVRVSGYELRTDCKITVVRRGVNYHRLVDLYVPGGAEAKHLEKVRAALPAAYKPRITDGVLSAAAEDFVRLTGTVLGRGQVRIAVYTGCRPYATGAPEPSIEVDRSPMAALFGTLGIQPRQWQAHRVGCATTIVGTAPGAEVGPLPARFEDRELVVATENLLVFRDPDATVVVETGGGAVTVSRTVGCVEKF